MPPTKGIEGRLKGEAGEEIGGERRTSCREYWFGRHRKRV